MSATPESVFVEPPETIAGLELRPLTAGTLILLKQTKNPLLDGKVDGDDKEFHVAAFLYIHAGDAKQVRKAAANESAFREAVLEFADKLSIADFAQSANKIKDICERSMVGMTYEVEGGNGENPNG